MLMGEDLVACGVCTAHKHGLGRMGCRSEEQGALCLLSLPMPRANLGQAGPFSRSGA